MSLLETTIINGLSIEAINDIVSSRKQEALKIASTYLEEITEFCSNISNLKEEDVEKQDIAVVKEIEEKTKVLCVLDDLFNLNINITWDNEYNDTCISNMLENFGWNQKTDITQALSNIYYNFNNLEYRYRQWNSSNC